ncbi:hypothetical protein [Solirubrobacter soli]|uniref:hypothetical protein n=1 Tax=Solirubrobacter soli TaxID=363832 RepID=UPI00041B1BFE|nr:hypothetical protein [Solirubrobacter soli]
MSAPEPHRAASEQLLDQLMEAARRDEAAATPRRARRRRRRGIALLAAVVLGGAAAAGAADLISTGEPVPDHTVRGARYDPNGFYDLAAKAKDSTGAASWGVGVYTSQKGLDCSIAGQVRGVQLGLIRDGKFHAFATGSSGSCGDLSRFPILSDRLQTAGEHPRTIIYGRSSRPDREVAVDFKGKTHSAPPARGGAFIFVFDGHLQPNEAYPRLGKRIQR